MQSDPCRHCRLLTTEELADLLGIGRRTCWRLAARAEAGDGDFPRPLRLGSRMVRWRLADVEVYIASLAMRRGERHRN